MSGMALGDRMKTYEAVTQSRMTPRMPKILRIDGKAFHSYTRGFVKPFDPEMFRVWGVVMKSLCRNIMGAKLAYAQSDECSILVTDYDNLDTQGWFDNEVQKWTSVAGSMTTAFWNREMVSYCPDRLAMFDARCFVIPSEEVANYFVWRQKDAVKNSISSLAHAHFSPKQLHGLNGAQMQELLFQEKGINWAHLPGWQKNGFCAVKGGPTEEGGRPAWVVDDEIPVFTADRAYIEGRLPG